MCLDLAGASDGKRNAPWPDNLPLPGINRFPSARFQMMARVRRRVPYHINPDGSSAARRRLQPSSTSCATMTYES